MYAFEDTTTARLSSGDGESISWWQHPINVTDLYLMCYGAGSAADFGRGLAQLAAVTGRAPLMPLASYGVWYSGCCIEDLYNQTAVSDAILAPYRALDLPLDFFVLDFYWHRGGWSGYSFDTTRFPHWERIVSGLRSGWNAYGAPVKIISNMHPNGHVITNQSEDNYDGFARAMGHAPGERRNFSCDFYNQTYMAALQAELLAPVMDYPWVDCSCTSRGCCSGAELNKSGRALQPLNLDFQLQTNYAFDALYAKADRRGLTLNRLPGRADGSNYNDALLNGSCSGAFGSCLRGNLGAHRYPAAWTGDIGWVEDHLVHSIALLPAACAGHLWCAFSIDIGPFGTQVPYGDGTAAADPKNAARYIRFVQWGTFSPIFRPHDGANADTRIWTFAPEHYAILRDFVRLRGALTPWVYALGARLREEAWPFVRPMWWDFAHVAAEQQEDAWRMSEQYMFGAVLVRPISRFISPADADPQAHTLRNASVINCSTYSVWLPPGVWLTWNGSNAYVGPTRLSRAASLAEVPAFVPANTVLPMWPPGRRAVPPELRTRLWALWLHGGSGAGTGSDFEDDGETLSGGAAVSSLVYNLSHGWLDVNISQDAGAFPGMPATKAHALQLRGLQRAPTAASCCVTCKPCEPLPARAIADYNFPGFWRVAAADGEMAAPAGAVIVVCAEAPREASLRINVTFA